MHFYVVNFLIRNIFAQIILFPIISRLRKHILKQFFTKRQVKIKLSNIKKTRKRKYFFQPLGQHPKIHPFQDVVDQGVQENLKAQDILTSASNPSPTPHCRAVSISMACWIHHQLHIALLQSPGQPTQADRRASTVLHIQNICTVHHVDVGF